MKSRYLVFAICSLIASVNFAGGHEKAEKIFEQLVVCFPAMTEHERLELRAKVIAQPETWEARLERVLTREYQPTSRDEMNRLRQGRLIDKVVDHKILNEFRASYFAGRMQYLGTVHDRLETLASKQLGLLDELEHGITLALCKTKASVENEAAESGDSISDKEND